MLKLVETLQRRTSRQRLKISIPVLAPAAPRKPLAIVAIARDEAEYLREWLEFHLMMGAEHVYLYDNQSSDDTRGLVRSYEDRNLVTRINWPNPSTESPQLTAYADAIVRFGRFWRWMAFIDIDEFLYSGRSSSVVDVLQSSFADHAAVEVAWRNFGFSGHASKPAGPVIESYTARAPMDVEDDQLRKVKSIVDPCRVSTVFSAHRFTLRDGSPTRLPAESGELRINHYFTKSRDEFERKLAQQAVFWGNVRHSAQREVERRHDIAAAVERAPVRDDEILRFVPALRARL
ncbi:MAG: glycosyltransferase family 92 protein [Hyphomicrobiales bacterium]